MANYQLLKADIDAKVYENARQKITGENLNSVLKAMVATLGAEYQFAGVATIDTNPGTPDAKVFYIANGKGTYTNFGSLEVTEDEVVVLYWDTAWHKVATGIASQAKLSELENKVGGNVEEVDYLNDGYLVRYNGHFEPTTTAGWKTTDFIKVQKGDIVTYGEINSLTSLSISAYTTDDETGFVYDKSIQGSATSSGTYVVPDGISYIRSSASRPNGVKIIVNHINKIEDIYEKIDDLNNEITKEQAQLQAQLGKLEKEVYVNFDLSVNGYIDKWTGSVVENQSWKATTLVSVKEKDSISIQCVAKNGAVIACYDKYKAYIPSKSIVGTDGYNTYNLSIPEGVSYIALCAYRPSIEGNVPVINYEPYNTLRDIVYGLNEVKYDVFESIKKPIVFTGKNITAFGDSITYGVCSPNLVNDPDSAYIKVFAQMVGANMDEFYNFAQSGSTFSYEEGSTFKCIMEKVQSIGRKIFNTHDVDNVWIAGGVNDYHLQRPLGVFGSSDTTTVYGALKEICEHIKTNWYDANVIFVTPIPVTSASKKYNLTIPIECYREAICRVAISYGFNVVRGELLGFSDQKGGYGNIMIDDSDGVHPTIEGHKLYARSLTGKLL